MKANKKNLLKDRILIGIVIILILVLAGVIIYMVTSSQKIKECENRLHSLDSGAHVVTAEHDGMRVVLSEKNREQLMSILGSAKVWSSSGGEETLDEIHFTFDGDKIWDLYIYLIDDEYLRMEIKGEENYTILSDNNGRFEKYAKLASEEGWETENRVIE